MDEPLRDLARLLRQRTAVDREIGALLGRPAHAGHVGEFIAARVFEIELHPSAAHRGSDGVFRSGPLAGSTVNVKFYSALDGLLDVPEQDPPDLVLVLAGPRKPDPARTCLIESVFLFDYRRLLEAGVVPGVAASVRRALWDEARLFPDASPRALVALSARQRALLALFGARDD